VGGLSREGEGAAGVEEGCRGSDTVQVMCNPRRPKAEGVDITSRYRESTEAQPLDPPQLPSGLDAPFSASAFLGCGPTLAPSPAGRVQGGCLQGYRPAPAPPASKATKAAPASKAAQGTKARAKTTSTAPGSRAPYPVKTLAELPPRTATGHQKHCNYRPDVATGTAVCSSAFFNRRTKKFSIDKKFIKNISS
jgi:hypothetical protein